MKTILFRLYILLFAAAIIGCSKEEEGWIELDERHLFVMDYGQSDFITFRHSNIVKMSVTSYPDGWTIKYSVKEKKITAIAPDADDTTAVKSGLVYVSASTADDESFYTSFLVSVADRVALDDPNNDQQANSMIVTQPNTIYTFNPNRRGEQTTEVETKAIDCKIIWRTSGYPIRFVDMTDEGDISFYTYPDWEDNEMILGEGNAIIAALGENDEVLWSWHIWATNGPVESVDVAGMQFMDRNIGSFMNDNSSEDNILKSYGLYYQWGRKDPFIYPNKYNASGSEDAPLYDDDANYIDARVRPSNALYGTLLYTQLNPDVFVTAESDSNRDWLYEENQNGELWSSNGEKSIYDPSPKGYRVPSAEEYKLLTLDESEDDSLTLESYGRKVSGELFMAYGFRTYIDYSIQNFKADGSFARWAGYYWSSDSNGADSDALYFDKDGVIKVVKAHRATGMQIRPIKM